MLKYSKHSVIALASAAAIGFTTLPASAQYYAKTAYDYYPDYGYTYVTPTYVNPNYVSPVYYDDDHYYDRRSVVGPVVRGAAAGSLIGLGVSFLEPRHRRHYGRNIGIGAGIGAGVGLLNGLFGW